MHFRIDEIWNQGHHLVAKQYQFQSLKKHKKETTKEFWRDMESFTNIYISDY